MFLISSVRAILTTALLAFIAGWLFGAGAFVQKAHAGTISPGELMYTDFFLWPDWRENLALYDCTNRMWYFMENAPPSPIVDAIVPPPALIDPPPVVVTPPVIIPDVPEPSTFSLMLLGFGLVGLVFGRNSSFVRALGVTGALWLTLGMAKANPVGVTIDCAMVNAKNMAVTWSFTGIDEHMLTETSFTVSGVTIPSPAGASKRWTIHQLQSGVAIIHSLDAPDYDIVAENGNGSTVQREYRVSMVTKGQETAAGVCIIGGQPS